MEGGADMVSWCGCAGGEVLRGREGGSVGREGMGVGWEWEWTAGSGSRCTLTVVW
jgi:hypothetical protein